MHDKLVVLNCMTNNSKSMEELFLHSIMENSDNAREDRWNSARVSAIVAHGDLQDERSTMLDLITNQTGDLVDDPALMKSIKSCKEKLASSASTLQKVIECRVNKDIDYRKTT